MDDAGYGKDQDAQNRRGQGDRGEAPDPQQSRGERYDELSGGGRGPESVSFDRARDGDDFADDQREHQDRGQSEAEEEVDTGSG